MRNAFAAEITTLASEDKRIVLLSGDIGNKLFDGYKAQNPERFFNCGVAEANMTSMAAGMASCGLLPVTYTITAFNTVRCLEQIRVDVCYQNLPVVIVGVGGGLSYAELGGTHHACEDIALLRALPKMRVVCPADAWEVRAALRDALRNPGPTFIRLGKKGEPAVYTSAPDFQIGRANLLRKGSDLCLLATGNMVFSTLEVASRLETKGIQATVYSFHTVKPLDEECLKNAFMNFPLVTTIEEHSVIGGLGSAIAEWVIDHPKSAAYAQLLRFGTADQFMHHAGKQNYARQYFGLDSDTLCQRIESAYRERVK